MEWTRVDVQSDNPISGENGGLSDLKVGLDTDAESMHKVFLGTLSHLEEVGKNHESMISKIESEFLGDSVTTVGDLLSEIGGEWSESEIRLPSYHFRNNDFLIDTRWEDSSQIVRIISPEKFGGMLRSFRLPEGRRVSRAIREGEVISIKLD